MVWSFSVIFLEFTQSLNNVVLFLFLLVVLKFDECVEQNRLVCLSLMRSLQPSLMPLRTKCCPKGSLVALGRLVNRVAQGYLRGWGGVTKGHVLLKGVGMLVVQLELST